MTWRSLTAGFVLLGTVACSSKGHPAFVGSGSDPFGGIGTQGSGSGGGGGDSDGGVISGNINFNTASVYVVGDLTNPQVFCPWSAVEDVAAPNTATGLVSCTGAVHVQGTSLLHHPNDKLYRFAPDDFTASDPLANDTALTAPACAFTSWLVSSDNRVLYACGADWYDGSMVVFNDTSVIGIAAGNVHLIADGTFTAKDPGGAFHTLTDLQLTVVAVRGKGSGFHVLALRGGSGLELWNLDVTSEAKLGVYPTTFPVGSAYALDSGDIAYRITTDTSGQLIVASAAPNAAAESVAVQNMSSAVDLTSASLVTGG